MVQHAAGLGSAGNGMHTAPARPRGPPCGHRDRVERRNTSCGPDPQQCDERLHGHRRA